MKKIIAIAAAAALLVSAATVAFAEETGSNTAAGTKAAQKVSVPQDIKDKREIVKLLNEENRKLASDLKAGRDNSNHPLKNLKDKLKGMKLEVQNFKSSREAALTLSKAAAAKLKDLNQQLREAIKNKDTAKAAALKEEISQVKKQLTDKKAELEKLKDDFADDRAAVKAAQEKYTPIKDQLKALAKQGKKATQDAKSLKEKLAGYDKELKEQLKAKDFTAASATLDKIIEAKKSIHADLAALADIQGKIKALTATVQ